MQRPPARASAVTSSGVLTPSALDQTSRKSRMLNLATVLGARSVTREPLTPPRQSIQVVLIRD